MSFLIIHDEIFVCSGFLGVVAQGDIVQSQILNIPLIMTIILLSDVTPVCC